MLWRVPQVRIGQGARGGVRVHLAALTLASVALCAQASADVLINNGLAPPEPANAIVSELRDDLTVRNRG